MADLKEIPNRDEVEDGSGIIARSWLKWLSDLRMAVNRLIAGIFDGNVTVNGNVTVTGNVSATNGTFSGILAAASAAIVGAITAASATISGAITAATLTLSGLLTLTGGQIQFPAVQIPSAGANVLDDFEEGSFTPTSPDIAYAAAAANYLKIGSWVFITGEVVFPATANGAQAQINDLPFTCENSQQARGGCVCHFTNANIPVGLIVSANTGIAGFVKPNTGGATLTNAELTGVTVFFSFKYRAVA